MKRIMAMALLLGGLFTQPPAAATSPQPANPYPTPATATMLPTDTPAPTATATTWPTDPPTPWVVTATPEASATPTVAGPLPDQYEPNDDAGQAAPVTLGSVDKLSFWPLGDVDYFALTIKPSQAGLTLTVDTSIASGLDTQLQLVAPDGSLLAQNDDVSATDVRASLATRVISPGLYLIAVTNVAQARPDFKTYQLLTALVTVPPAPALPAAPSLPAEAVADAYSGNYAWDFAAAIPVGAPIRDLTFGCPDFAYLDLATCVVPDFFRLTVKGGTCYTAATADLAAGVDTNMIVYGPERDQAAPWGGNDDQTAGDFASAVEFCVPPELGVTDAYLLIGQVGNRPPPPPIGARTYSLLVTVLVQLTPTPTPPAPTTPTSAPAPTLAPTNGGWSSSGSGNGGGGSGYPGTAPPPVVPVNPPDPDLRIMPAPTEPMDPGPLTGLVVEEIPLSEAAAPTSVPQRVVPLVLTACYDRNQNGACDIDEGIAGLSVYVTDGRSGAILGQALTDPSG